MKNLKIKHILILILIMFSMVGLLLFGTPKYLHYLDRQAAVHEAQIEIYKASVEKEKILILGPLLQKYPDYNQFLKSEEK